MAEQVLAVKHLHVCYFGVSLDTLGVECFESLRHGREMPHRGRARGARCSEALLLAQGGPSAGSTHAALLGARPCPGTPAALQWGARLSAGPWLRELW